MQRMTGMDASFFYLETPDTHMHVVGTLIIDPSTMPGGYSYEAIKQLFADKLHLLPPFRKKVKFVPFGIDHPVWVDDDSFDIDYHFRRIGAPAPGGMDELAEVVGHIASVPLDRTKPLWSLTVVENLEDGHVALVTKMHHAAIDGTSGADLMVHLFDFEPEPQTVTPPTQEWRPQPPPTDWELVSSSLLRRLGSPARMVKVARNTVRSAVDVVQSIRGADETPALPLTAPKVQFAGALTPHRSVAYGRTELDDFKMVKNEYGVKVNDVVLAACCWSLRQWLRDHDDLPDKPLIASVPVSVRTDEQAGDLGNRVSAMFAPIPVQLDDPVDQLMFIHGRMNAAKEMHEALGADMLQDWAEVFGPAIFTQASRMYSRMRLADRHPPIHNLVISNVPGPPVPLYMGGARVVSTYPMGPILFGAGLNLTVLSNMGNVDFGAIGCRELVPDIDDLPKGFEEGIRLLRKQAEKRSAGTKPKAPKAPKAAAKRRPRGAS